MSIPKTPTDLAHFDRDNRATQGLFDAIDRILDTFADLGAATQPEWPTASPEKRLQWMRQQTMVAVELFFQEALSALSNSNLTEEERSAWMATVREQAKRF